MMVKPDFLILLLKLAAKKLSQKSAVTKIHTKLFVRALMRVYQYTTSDCCVNATKTTRFHVNDLCSWFHFYRFIFQDCQYSRRCLREPLFISIVRTAILNLRMGTENDSKLL